MNTPTRFWLVSGTGESDNSLLNSIDNAYINSGIGYQNHVIISSIPPALEIFPRIEQEKGITFVPLNGDWKMIPLAEVIYVVRAQETGLKGEILASSISLMKVILDLEEEQQTCILAFESTGNNLEETKMASILGVKTMTKQRNVQIDVNWGDQGLKSITSSIHVKSKFGCSVSFVVFDPFTCKL